MAYRWIGCLLTMGALALSGCSTPVAESPDDGGMGDADVAPSTSLEVVDEPRLGLVFGEGATFRVRYRRDDGTPIEGGTVRFALDGNAHDSTLDEVEATTGTDGIARGTVLAGTTRAAFRVRVTAEGAAAVFLDVSVSDRGFGTLRAEIAPYDGERTVDHVVLNVFAATSCDAEGLLGRTADRSKRLSLEESSARFLGLPADLSYAVTARGENAGDEALAWACVDGIEVMADDDVRTDVALSDLPLEVAGEYDMAADVAAPEVAATFDEAATSSGLAPVMAAG
ncbi:MAG: hypothetical protein ACOCUS_03010, partial [Polyangiales bacterium]